MDKSLRNTLRNVVTQSRKLLEEAISQTLQGTFGIHASGEVESEANMSHLSTEDQAFREQLIIHLRHIEAGGFKTKEAVAQLIREVAFTHLNRLCAYKMMETRGLIREAVSRGVKSQGFMFYLAEHAEVQKLWSGGKQDEAYKHFLEWLGGTLSQEIGVLFSPTDPANRLFPSQNVLEQVLDLINSSELKDIWVEDEAVGWVYQYFTPKELRDQTHKETRAPRNSYELAFLNQFFTPRYVVEFLVDNTLGRMWYEMRQGKTELKDKCRYLVRRYDEVFLAEREKADRPSTSQIQADAAFFFGETDQEIPPFETSNEKHWLEQTAEKTYSLRSETDGAAMRLHYFAHLNRPFNWRDDPRQEEWQALLTDLNQGDPQQLVEGKTQDLWDCTLAVARADRFTEGLFSANLVAIARIANELRRRVLQMRQTDLPQAEMLKLPVFIPFHKAKDPRDLKILDPACGSGHFLLYCFDLLEVIYRETYEDEELGQNLRTFYPTPEDFRKAVPGLILAHNLHGIDIDFRATQIAALALWLRAQRSYQQQGLKREQRPQITRTNIVCAEPMPGEKELLDEFATGLQPPVLGQLVKAVFEKMKLASEAGSLLKIEEELKDAIQAAKKQWEAKPKAEQLEMFPAEKKPTLEQLRFDLRGITDEEFWNEAENRVLEALREYANRATDGNGLLRSLFCEDASRGFAFIDLCRKRYNILLMNPPFGEPCKTTKNYVETVYLKSKGDLLANFIERALDLLIPSGYLGAISSRTCFFLGSFFSFRQEILLKRGNIELFADLGDGVLDAMVETATYLITKNKFPNRKSIYFRLLIEAEKSLSLQESIIANNGGKSSRNNFYVNNEIFSKLQGSPFAYWIPNKIINILANHKKLEGNLGSIRVGLQTSNDARFLRLIWEVPPKKIGSNHKNKDDFQTLFRNDKKWAFYSKTDTASLWLSPITLVVDWEKDGLAIKEYAKLRGESASRTVRSEDKYFQPGFSYMLRSTRLVPYIVPKGVIPTAGRSQAYPVEGEEYTLLGYCASNLASAVARFSGGMFARPTFQASMIQNLPVSNLTQKIKDQIIGRIITEYNNRREMIQTIEPYHYFICPTFITNYYNLVNNKHEWNLSSLLGRELELKIADSFGLSAEELEEMERDINEAISLRFFDRMEEFDSDDEFGAHESIVENLYSKIESLLSYITGCIFGRWDIRLATGQREIPELPDPFAPLPACSPGMLTGEDGLPLSSTPPDYPLEIDWDGILTDDADHSDDVVRRVRDVLELLWKEKAEAIEQEACGILGVKELRDYFRNSGKGGFWLDHVQRYSKSRRKAPIYWLLQSSKKNYSLWLYYHRLDKDILYKALVNYVEPKIKLEQGKQDQLLAQRQGESNRQLERQIEKQEAFVSELEDFRDKLARAAKLGLEPDLNDGVVLNIAPLWELVPWAEAKKYWDELKQGKYEWSNIGKQLREKGLVK